MPSEIDPMAKDLLALAADGKSPDKIVNELKKLYPDAKRKDVMRTAFHLVVDIVGSNPDAALSLQELAISNSGPE